MKSLKILVQLIIFTLCYVYAAIMVSKEVSERYNVVGTHLYAVHDNRIITRNFAPLYDINEEAATGTLNGALAC